MISPSTLDFLADLKQNNDRTWFTANKPRYEAARREFEDFIGALIPRIAQFDPLIARLEAKKCIFRIYKDTRFAKDKSPYKTNFGAHLVEAAERPHDRAGYYIHVEPGNIFLGGGAYIPPSSWLNAIRRAIDRDGQTLVAIINSPEFKKYFGEMEGEQLKTRPKDYPADHPHIDLLKRKSFLAMRKVTDAETQQAGFVDQAARIFKALKPFDDFLNQAMEG